MFKNIIYFDSKVLISTVSEIYKLTAKSFQENTLRVPHMKCKAYISSGDGILIVAETNEAVIYNYDGTGKWERILDVN